METRFVCFTPVCNAIMHSFGYIDLGDPGGKVENVSPLSPACRKGRLNGAISRNNCIKKGWPRVDAWTGTYKNPTKCLWRWKPDRRSNFFFSPPAHICAVTYVTEISLIVMLNNQFTSHLRLHWKHLLSIR